jgi:hypothetical protein
VNENVAAQAHVAFEPSEKIHSTCIPKLPKALKSSMLVQSHYTMHHFEADGEYRNYNYDSFLIRGALSLVLQEPVTNYHQNTKTYLSMTTVHCIHVFTPPWRITWAR